jgi:hypothetical protein
MNLSGPRSTLYYSTENLVAPKIAHGTSEYVARNSDHWTTKRSSHSNLNVFIIFPVCVSVSVSVCVCVCSPHSPWIIHPTDIWRIVSKIWKDILHNILVVEKIFIRIFRLVSLFWKNKFKLVQSPYCLCVCLSSPINFSIPAQTFDTLYVRHGIWADLNGLCINQLRYRVPPSIYVRHKIIKFPSIEEAKHEVWLPQIKFRHVGNLLIW